MCGYMQFLLLTFTPRDERVIVKFKGRNDYLCSSVGLMQKKVILHLLDVVNVLVLYGSSTLVIQVAANTLCYSIGFILFLGQGG